MRSLFETRDLAEAEAFLSETYSRTRLSTSAHRPLTRVERAELEAVGVDRIEFDFDMSYQTAPTGRIAVGSVTSGFVPSHVTEGRETGFGQGDVVVFAQPERPCKGRQHDVHVDLVTLEPSMLAEVAETAPGLHPVPVRLTGLRPVDRAAETAMRHTICYVQGALLDGADDLRTPMIGGTAARLLCATLLATFPNNAVLVPTADDRRDAHPEALGRAIAFIDGHVDGDISPSDIAAAARVSVRAVQLAFRRHLDTTPMTYVRRVRMTYAHEELEAASSTEGSTVSSIAAHWGFFNSGRFAVNYRKEYGETPSQTLAG
jgi:AraC-like DNA-binding protein